MKDEWFIPEDMLVEGWILSRRNATRLIKSAEILFKNYQFSASLSLSVLALEEYGKFLMLKDAEQEKKRITSSIWQDEFRDHLEKLKATPTILSKEKTRFKKEKVVKAMNQISEIFAKWGSKKLQNIYVDWDPIEKKWAYPGGIEEDLESISKEILDRTKNLLVIYEKMGDLVNHTNKEKLELLNQKKAYVFCEKCGEIMWDKIELQNHKDRHDVLQLSWWKISDN